MEVFYFFASYSGVNRIIATCMVLMLYQIGKVRVAGSVLLLYERWGPGRDVAPAAARDAVQLWGATEQAGLHRVARLELELPPSKFLSLASLDADFLIGIEPRYPVRQNNLPHAKDMVKRVRFEAAGHGVRRLVCGD